MKIILNEELEKKITYYKSEFNQGFYNELRNKITPLIENGVSINFIKNTYKLRSNEIIFLLTSQDKKGKFVPILGSKTESYYTEDEMMKPISYSYEDLSPDEKKIYNEKL
jgi:hypothetical protein